MRWKVKKGLLLIPGLTLSMGLCAAVTDIVDVYGINKKEANKILKQYSKEIAEIEPIILQEVMKPSSLKNFSQRLKTSVERKYALLQEISKKNGYLFVDFQTVLYPQNDTYYTTIEIVDKKHPERMHFVSTMPMRHSTDNSNKKSSSHKADVIDAMHKYTHDGLKMVFRHELGTNTDCPVYHCLAGFDHPKLKPYLARFNKAVIDDKKLIIETLRHDKNAERRTAAAFLVGHFKDPHEIIKVLTPSVVDKDDGVRNGAIRVIASTMSTAHIKDIDVAPFLTTLDSPYTTDRNKALLVLLDAADSQTSKQIILQKGGDKLLELLELQQPNNHETAYLILKKISGKDFGSTNLAAWRSWVHSQVA
jgi:hypothetical protein